MDNDNTPGDTPPAQNVGGPNEILATLAESMANLTQNLSGIGERLTNIEKGRMTNSEAAANALSYAAPVTVSEDDVIDEFKKAAFKRLGVKEPE